MLFNFCFSDKHLKTLKKHPDALYKLIGKFILFSDMSFEELITLEKNNGITKISGNSIHKKLSIDIQLDLYKIRLSKKYRCYCTKNLFNREAMNILFIDVQHKI